jgi:hypothetical protein
MHSGGGEREKMSALIIYILRRSSRFYLPAVRIHGRVTRDSERAFQVHRSPISLRMADDPLGIVLSVHTRTFPDGRVLLSRVSSTRYPTRAYFSNAAHQLTSAL